MLRHPFVRFTALLALASAAWAQQPDPQSPVLEGKGIADAPKEQQVRGAIARFTRAPTGEIDGFVLDRGLMVHFPAYLAPKVRALLGETREVEVRGIVARGTDPDGTTVLEARAITNPASGRTLTVTAAAGGIPGTDGSATGAAGSDTQGTNAQGSDAAGGGNGGGGAGAR